MIGRADIEGSKSNVATNAWLPQASYPCGNFSDTSSWTAFKRKGSIGHVFTVCIHTENHNQASISPEDIPARPASPQKQEKQKKQENHSPKNKKNQKNKKTIGFLRKKPEKSRKPLVL